MGMFWQKPNVLNMFTGLLGILDGLIRIFTLGMRPTQIEMSFWCWYMNKKYNSIIVKWANKDTKLLDIDEDDIVDE